MQTTLSLLTRNGVVYLAFKPSLNADQYARLLEIANTAQTEDDLRDAVRVWALTERLAVRFEE